MTNPDRWALPPLTARDRCDWPACAASAVLRVVLATGDLYACAHHYGRNADALRPVTLYLQDERLAPRTDSEGLEDVGRMHMRRGLTHADPCRWCTTRLVNRRVAPRSLGDSWRDYFICPVCDESASPDMETLLAL